ncbi:MAG: hypothetical protein KAT15_07055, partial [Bacteroidales bacterium]|nr:hypothetical protein [Bacteroidales bacterium]
MKIQSIIIFAISITLQCGCGGQSTGEVNTMYDPSSDSLFYAEMDQNRQWPSFRGHYARGFLDNTDLPDQWNIETMENVRWKIPIPGLGLSCPVIWEDYVFITSAISESDDEGIRTGIYGAGEPVDDESVHHWMVYAIDKLSGEIRWEKTAHTGIPEVKRHPKSSHANPTIATNGQFVIAFFGSEGIYCYDFNGALIWERDFGLL